MTPSDPSIYNEVRSPADHRVGRVQSEGHVARQTAGHVLWYRECSLPIFCQVQRSSMERQINRNSYIEIESSLIELESSLIQLKSSLIQLESSLIQLERSLIQLLSSLYMYN